MVDKFAIFLDFDDVLIEPANQNRPVQLKSTYWLRENFVFNSTSVNAVYELIYHLRDADLAPVIVLSTSWIKYATRKVLNEVLSRHFPQTVIYPDLTFSCKPVVPTRRDRINTWLLEYSDQLATPQSYFVLDDTNSGTGLIDHRNPTAAGELDSRTLLVNHVNPGLRFLTSDHVTLIKSQLTI
jgi:hypothetical protein